MALSKTSKTGLALGAMLPVLGSLYGEIQQQNQASEQQQQARSALIQRQHAEAVERDLQTAQKLLQQIATESQQPLCEQFYIASELVRLGGYSKATRRSLISALRYRPESGDDSRPRVCACPGTLAQMRSSWRPTLGSTADADVVAEMNRGLDQTEALCAPQSQAAEPMPEVAALPPPPPPPPPAAAMPYPGAGPPPEIVTGSSMEAGDRALPARCEVAPQPPAVPVRVYLQIADESQRADAQELARQLGLHGYSAAGVERVGNAASPQQLQLRYVYNEDKTEADRLIANLIGCHVAFALPPMTRFRQRTPRYSFELWFPRLAAAAPESAP
jgi:hypothetical protein